MYGSDYLTVPGSSDFVLDGDFTIECFVYFISGSVMVDFARSGSYANAWQIYNQSPTFYGYSSGSGGNAFMTSDTPLSKGWNHLVVTRTISNNTARMFINGVQTASSTDFDETYGNDASNVLMVGAQNASGPTAYFTGYISNLRIIKGTALYTSDFTPPTRALTNVTNTKLLCCQSVAEQQNNFIRMFKSSTLYTTKADILANATEIGDGATLSNEYWYIIPTGDEPIGSDVFTNDGSITTPHASNNFALYWRNGSSWTQTIGTYGPSEYSDF